MSNTKLAYIDDKDNNLEFISLILKNDFNVSTFEDPDVFLNQYKVNNFEIILVDIHMPKMDGFCLYEKIIEQPHYNGCPIIFISSDDSDRMRVKSFSLGAVDFLSRLMLPDEIISRIKSKILFFQKHRSVIEFGDLKLNLTLLKAYLGRDELKLTFLEFKLLSLFVKNYPDSIKKEELAEKIWNTVNIIDATMYTHIFNLNSKLINWDHEVVNERNKGARLVKKKDSK